MKLEISEERRKELFRDSAWHGEGREGEPK